MDLEIQANRDLLKITVFLEFNLIYIVIFRVIFDEFSNTGIIHRHINFYPRNYRINYIKIKLSLRAKFEPNRRYACFCFHRRVPDAYLY